MSSYTFVFTANVFVLRGGVLVFADIREDTQNLLAELIQNDIGAVLLHVAAFRQQSGAYG